MSLIVKVGNTFTEVEVAVCPSLTQASGKRHCFPRAVLTVVGVCLTTPSGKAGRQCLLEAKVELT